MTEASFIYSRFRGVILGTAAGDALGLPAEGMSAARIRKIYPGPWRHRFLPGGFSLPFGMMMPKGYGMISDDTEHTFFTAQSLIAHPDDPEKFGQRMARSLKWWIAGLPAGVGFATLRAGLKLWAGAGYQKSGVWSAGNGPAMRSAMIGAFFAGQPENLTNYITITTQITHTDPKALTGALAAARITAWAVQKPRHDRPALAAFEKILQSCGSDNDWQDLITAMKDGICGNLPVAGFAEKQGWNRGITGYVYQTVPIALYAWYQSFGDFRSAVESVLNLGGDTDTVAAITGAMAGAVTGEEGIPSQWIQQIREWPRGVDVLKQAADCMAEIRLAEITLEPPASVEPVSYSLPGVLPRNLFFLIAVLLHGFRRLLPPY